MIVDLAIRAADMNDAAALAQLMTELGYETSVPDMQMRLETILPDARYRMFVAVEQGKVCGAIGTTAFHSFEHNDMGGRILALVVSQTRRRSGIGRQLIAAAEKDFARRNIRRMAVNTHLRRADAHEFYARLGFERNGYRFVKDVSS